MQGKLIRRRRKTKTLSVAKLRLADLEKAERQRAQPGRSAATVHARLGVSEINGSRGQDFGNQAHYLGSLHLDVACIHFLKRC